MQYASVTVEVHYLNKGERAFHTERRLGEVTEQ